MLVAWENWHSPLPGMQQGTEMSTPLTQSALQGKTIPQRKLQTETKSYTLKDVGGHSKRRT